MRIKTATLIILINCCLCSGAVWASEAEDIAMKKGIFSGSLADALWTVIAFGVLVAALGKFAWRPLLNGLKEREERIRLEIQGAENARRQAEKTLSEYNSRVEQIEQRARQITEKAEKEAQKLAREIAEKARQEATELKQKVQSDIEAAHATAKEQLWQDAGDIVLAVGSKVLGRTITNEDNQRLIRDAVEKLKGGHVTQGDSV